MQDNNYITIQGWMINQLHLQGNALLVYALVYGFCQDGESDYHGNIQYICDTLRCTKPTAIKALKDLCEQGLIEKEERRGMTSIYRVSKIFTRKESLQGELKNLTGGSKESLPNNKRDIDIYNSNNNTNKEKPQKIEYAPKVFLTENEHAKLVMHYGTDGADAMVQKLSIHKGANGKSYKSDYLAILNWVVDWYQRQSKNPLPNSATPSPSGRPSKLEGNIRTLVELNQDYQIETDDIPF